MRFGKRIIKAGYPISGPLPIEWFPNRTNVRDSPKALRVFDRSGREETEDAYNTKFMQQNVGIAVCVQRSAQTERTGAERHKAKRSCKPEYEVILVCGSRDRKPRIGAVGNEST